MTTHMFLAQVPNATPTQIGEWLVSAAAVAVIFAALKVIFIRRPSIDAEFVTKADHEKDMNTIKDDIENVRTQMRTDVDKIVAKLDENKTDLMLDGRRRSQALFQHIKDQNTEIFARLLANDKKLAALEERTHGK